MIVLYKKYLKVVCLTSFFIIIRTLFPMYDITIFGENARLFKKYIYMLIKTTLITKIQKNIYSLVGSIKSARRKWDLIFPDILIRDGEIVIIEWASSYRQDER